MLLSTIDIRNQIPGMQPSRPTRSSAAGPLGRRTFMSKNNWLVILVAVVLALTISACQKSASNAPVTTPTTTGNLPFPTPLPDNALKNCFGRHPDSHRYDAAGQPDPADRDHRCPNHSPGHRESHTHQYPRTGPAYRHYQTCRDYPHGYPRTPGHLHPAKRRIPLLHCQAL